MLNNEQQWFHKEQITSGIFYFPLYQIYVIVEREERIVAWLQT